MNAIGRSNSILRGKEEGSEKDSIDGVLLPGYALLPLSPVDAGGIGFENPGLE